MNDKELRLYSISQAAKKLGIGKTNLSKLIEEGKIGTIELGGRFRIAHRELIKFIDENTVRQDIEEKEIDIDNFIHGSEAEDKPKEIITNEFFNKIKEAA